MAEIEINCVFKLNDIQELERLTLALKSFSELPKLAELENQRNKMQEEIDLLNEEKLKLALEVDNLKDSRRTLLLHGGEREHESTSGTPKDDG